MKIRSDAAMPRESTRVIGVLAVDDHLISKETDVRLLGEASSGREAVEQFRLLKPDVVLMDLQLPGMDGIDAMIAIRAEYSSAKIIVLTTYAGDALAQRALMAGAQAYLLKGSVRRELIDTIRAVYRGLKRVNPEVAVELAEHMGDEIPSARELEVLTLIAAGNSNRQIALALSITEETTKTHIKNIMEKLRANDRTHAVMLAFARGIIRLPHSGR
jgi:DNA-binding NarL/FixJ family response regulator